jgi:hypothetical protein
MSKKAVLYISLMAVGVAAALLVLQIIPGSHNALDAKLGIAIGAGVGYCVAYLIVK